MGRSIAATSPQEPPLLQRLAKMGWGADKYREEYTLYIRLTEGRAARLSPSSEAPLSIGLSWLPRLRFSSRASNANIPHTALLCRVGPGCYSTPRSILTPYRASLPDVAIFLEFLSSTFPIISVSSNTCVKVIVYICIFSHRESILQHS